MKLETVLLWFGPFLALFVGAGVEYYFARRARGGAALEVAPLNAEERARLARLIESEPSYRGFGLSSRRSPRSLPSSCPLTFSACPPPHCRPQWRLLSPSSSHTSSRSPYCTPH